MKQEEKLEEAKRLYKTANADQRYVLESLFPELAESEDEKIRQKFIKLVKMSSEVGGFALHKWEADEMLDWLEKQAQSTVIIIPKDLKGTDTDGGVVGEKGEQCEQKSADKSKFHEGDWIIHQGTENIYQVIARIDNQYQLKYGDNYTIQKCADVDRCARLWNIKDAKYGDVLCYKDEVFLYKHDIKDWKETSFGGVVYRCCYDGKRFITDSFYSLTEQDKIDIHPATKEQRDILFSKMAEAGFEWDSVNKELRMFEPKFNFKVGQWIVATGKCVYLIAKIDGFNVTLVDTIGNEYVFDVSSLADAHLWTIQDAKDGDVLSSEDKVFLYNGKFDLRGRVCAYCGIYKTYDGLRFTECAIGNYFTCKEPYPATKEQRDALMKAMADADYTFDFEKKELKKIEDEEYNGEDYGIDSLFHAQRILEKTLGKVEGYQSDDGILSHKCAITAIKKLYEQKSAKWTDEDECYMGECISAIATKDGWSFEEKRKTKHWLQYLKQRIGE